MDRRVLVVEDNWENRLVLVYRLRKIGDFEILEACNGREAVEIVSSDPPDLVFMDLRMPELDGWEATRQIRAVEGGRHVPIIAVTAQAMLGDDVRALAAGCDGYIPKPITHQNQITEQMVRLLGPRLLAGRMPLRTSRR
jgi:CheY-like chemotaxis protein